MPERPLTVSNIRSTFLKFDMKIMSLWGPLLFQFLAVTNGNIADAPPPDFVA
jgi:hypothetical protein